MRGFGRADAPRAAPPVPAVDEERIGPFRIVESRTAGGWAVMDAASLKVVEPGYLWRRREHALAWARRELAARHREALEYRRRQEEVVRRGLPQ
jgi:hypothetical protein